MIFYAFGDIHGQIERLESVLEKIKYGLDGKIIFLGDYSSRGKKSKQVIQKVKDLVSRQGAIALKGNHDCMMVRCWRNPDEPDSVYWTNSYLKSTKKSYYDTGSFDIISWQNHVTFLDTLPLTYESDYYFFSHSGDPSDFLWGRPLPNKKIRDKINVHGHTPINLPHITESEINIDTGCAWKDGTLTCVRLDDNVGKLTDIFQSR